MKCFIEWKTDDRLLDYSLYLSLRPPIDFFHSSPFFALSNATLTRNPFVCGIYGCMECYSEGVGTHYGNLSKTVLIHSLKIFTENER